MESHTPGRDTRDARYDHMWLGVVVDNQDPLKLGRVRILVDGLLDPKSKWAMPIGFMRGVKNGIFWVPEIDAQVVVFLNQGDVVAPYYMAGPFGAPDSVSDVPEQAPSIDHATIRWRGFHITFDGTQGTEKLTIEDLDSGTKLEMDKQTGNYLRRVRGSEVVNVKTNRAVTVEEGDETHDVTAGKRTTTIQGDDAETISVGDKSLTMPVGSETKTLTLGGSTESMPAGVKTISALTINLVASGAVNVTAGGAANVTAGGVATIVGEGVTVQSVAGGAAVSDSTGTTLSKSLGLFTETLLGGFISVITGAFSRTVSGVATWNFLGVANFLGSVIQMGTGTGGYKRLATEDFVLQVHNLHGHPETGGTTGPPTILGAANHMTNDLKAT